MGLLICLFGADGSGKTSIARYLAKYLRSQGWNTSIAWLRGSHTLASILARLLSRFNVFRGNCNPYYRICISSSMRKPWIFIEFISILPIIFLKFLAPKLLGRIVVAERCPIDFLVWLIITLRDQRVIHSFWGRTTLSLALSICDKIIYIRADQEALLSRRKGFEEEYLIPAQLRIYDQLAEWLRTQYIDTTNKTVAESISEIIRIIGDIK
ncbi:hypothetical protein [Staphylothermus hellenicus]|uniref:Thymidylate kinase-like protein n=1 Tax=Staphylothermus hellenicus (strain DSM 12710 / JCM 10830 / BK20S6-10-b1 / P8) TaxID=591019 RepID=D7D857_STAHD|nr:hypothetical protein [Staphylothermus hellenicus]ADI31953.1 hypothetical protein Shell_0841 [Staphylothermus hellenicus DSM 12710]